MKMSSYFTKCFPMFGDGFTMDFCSGVNILIGAAGTGKTALLRHLHSLEGEAVFFDGLAGSRVLAWAETWQREILQVVFDVLGGNVEWVPYCAEFCILREDGTRESLSHAGSGREKLGRLSVIIGEKNFGPGTVLLWDEPENGLSAELVPVLAGILLKLGRNGVQVVIATHNELLCEYFDILRERGEEGMVKFFSLYKDGGQIEYDEGSSFSMLNPNVLIDQSVKLYETRLDKVFGKE
jgi:hypothetical protein